MRLLLFGGSGAMGVLLARRFLAAYPQCTLILYVRDKLKLAADLVGARTVVIVEGELNAIDKLSQAMEGVHAVISALGPTGRKGPFYPAGTPIAVAYGFIILAMKKHDVRRLIVLTTPTVRDDEDGFSLPLVFLRKTFATIARNVVKDIEAVGKVVRETDLDWTLIRLALHSDDGGGGEHEIVAGYMGDGRIKPVSSRAGAATFIIDELERREWIRKAPILSN
ncbi:unnamed protein product [Mycena citricolor]|uniref:NAD(P)-binding domain-containing protein n=1 Tax=Mycena citricolor TaxID=2018698 RepID=A0AAD2HBN2_9AGAR|nr:unnamed protein product [Mycena citricolor]